ncbi:MAG: PKD domain-containing protein, partial [Bacteroidota bacterium]
MHGSDMGTLQVAVRNVIGEETVLFTLSGEQQPDMFDDWLPVQLELNGFTGQLVQLVFRGIRGSGVKSDMAIDDISITELPDQDIAINALLTPFDLICPATSNSVTVELVHKGTDTLFLHQDTLFLQADMTGPQADVLTDTLFSGFIAPGDTLPFTFSEGVDLQMAGVYTFEIRTTLANDGNPANDSLIQDVEPAVLVQAPYFADFEGGGPTDWRNTPNDGGKDWRYSQPTQAEYGPDTIDHTTGSGDYMWVDDTDPSSLNTQLWTPCIDLSTISTPFLECWVWSQNEGPDVDVLLHLDVERGGQWYPDMIPAIVSQGSAWEVFRVNLDSIAGEIVRFRFRAEEPGTGFRHDVAIDDFRIYAGQPADMTTLKFLGIQDSLCGDTASFARVVFEHAGADTLSNIPARVAISGPGGTDTLDLTIPGPLAFQERDTLEFGPFNTSAGGVHILTAWTAWGADGETSNDTLSASFAYRTLSAPALSLVGASCVEAPATIAGAADPLFWYAWFDTPDGSTALDTGDTYTTPPISSTTTVYAEAIGRPLNVGPADSTLGGGAPYDFFTDGLSFDVLQDLVLDSLRVYPNGAGELIINLRDSLGTMLFTDTSLVSSGTTDTMVALGWAIPRGDSYEIDATGTTLDGLYRNDAGVSYPYQIPNLLKIKTPVNGFTDFYYFFYDWRVRAVGCARPRGELTLIPENPPQANFLQSSFRFQLVTQNLSVGADSVRWTFGDGNSSNLANPFHTFADTGMYEVCLRTFNDCGVDSLCQVVQIICPAPKADFSFEQQMGNVVAFINLSQGADSVWFNFGSGQGSSDSLAQFDFGTPGLYTIQMVAFSPCGQDTVTQIVNVIGASIGIESSIPLRMYPNPARTHFALEADWPGASEVSIELLNVQGQIIERWNSRVQGQWQAKFPIRQLPAGLYIVNIQSQWGRSHLRLRVE